MRFSLLNISKFWECRTCAKYSGWWDLASAVLVTRISWFEQLYEWLVEKVHYHTFCFLIQVYAAVILTNAVAIIQEVLPGFWWYSGKGRAMQIIREQEGNIRWAVDIEQKRLLCNGGQYYKSNGCLKLGSAQCYRWPAHLSLDHSHSLNSNCRK